MIEVNTRLINWEVILLFKNKRKIKKRSIVPTINAAFGALLPKIISKKKVNINKSFNEKDLYFKDFIISGVIKKINVLASIYPLEKIVIENKFSLENFPALENKL